MSNKQTTAVSNIINRIDDWLLLNYDDSDEPKILELIKKYCISQLPIERKQIEDACDHISNIYEKHLKEDGDYFSSIDGEEYFTSTFADGE